MPVLTKTTLGSFAKELVLQLSPLSTLLDEWGLTDEDYEELRHSEFFQNELKSAVEEVRAIGGDAGFIYRCKILAEESLPKMLALMEAPNTPPEVKVSLWDKFTDLGRLKPTKQSTVDTGRQGPLVTFNFGAGMPGMPKTLEVIPLQVEEK